MPNYAKYPIGKPQCKPQRERPGPPSPDNLAQADDTSRGLALGIVALVLTAALLFGFIGLYSPPEDLDRDDDGIPDTEDLFPDDPDEWSDQDNDGIGDNSDPDRDGDGVVNQEDLDPIRDLAVSFSIDWVNLTTPLGRGQYGDFYAELHSNRSGELVKLAQFDDNGKSLKVPWQTRTELNWEIEINVPDNQSLHHFNLQAYEVYRWSPTLLDIDGSNSTMGLTIYYDIVTGNWSGDDSTGILDGALDNLTGDEEYDTRLGYHLTTVDFGYLINYQWSYQGDGYNLTHRFDPATYNSYASRSHRISYYGDFIDYATPGEPEVIAIAAMLNDTANERSMSDREKADFILAFVQSLRYTLDNTSQGWGEYPRYPVETLVDQMGDCEDTALLYISLLESLGIQSALLILPYASAEGGHAAAGVDVAGVQGSFYTENDRDYYYAETTSVGWTVGDMPPMDDTTAYVYPV